MKHSPDNIKELKPGEIMVFGSNLKGVHGAGAARTAVMKFGAEWGIGRGLMGQCYALPTKINSRRSMTLEQIDDEVREFLFCAREHPELTFLVTAVGCGYAGYEPAQIAPLFFQWKDLPYNVVLPKCFVDLKPEGVTP